MQLAETRGDGLRAEILQSTVDLGKTTDRAKEYERSKTSMIDITDLPKTEACHITWPIVIYADMQDSYTLMGQNMAAQYELQKLEPALRCELYQVKCFAYISRKERLSNRIIDNTLQLQLALSIKISELSLVVESAEAVALQEEENLIKISEEVWSTSIQIILQMSGSRPILIWHVKIIR